MKQARCRRIAGPVWSGVLLLALLGCAGTAQPPPVVSLPTNTMLDGSVRGDTEDATLARLWSDAEQARQDGDDQRAIDLLIQGLEIEPRNSLFWSRAAEIQLRNEQAALAENYAVKSNLYAGENRSLQLRNWLIIRHARSMRGDLLGVRSAEKKVQEYRYR